MLPELTSEEISRYARQIVLPDVGLAGQQKLKAASVLIVGTGGLGSPIALYLAAAGVGHIGLVDYDTVDPTNLQRQIIHFSDEVGKLKVASAKRALEKLNPDIAVEIFNLVFSAENALHIAEPYQILVDGTDNFASRYLLNDLAILTQKPYVYGSIYRYEGQVSVFDARVGPCYRCLFPYPPPPGTIPSCAQGGVFGVLPGTIGTIQATEVIKIILGLGQPLIGRLLIYDAMEMSFQLVGLKKDPSCPLCGEKPTITDLVDYEVFCGEKIGSKENQSAGEGWDITPKELAYLIQTGIPLQLVDVRSPSEMSISKIKGSIFIPLEELPNRLNELDRDKNIILICRTGVRSARAISLLVTEGFTKARNLIGGINAWADDVDPKIIKY